MEKITVHNYEGVYLDYLEGNLNKEGEILLFDYLNDNPELKFELDIDNDILNYTLAPNTESLSRFEKEDLKHFDCIENEICLNNVDDFIVAELEGEITKDQKVELNTFINEHDLQTSKEYFYATKLKPNLTEVYQNKTGLKKRGTIIPLFLKISSVAAVGLLMLTLYNQSDHTKKYSPRNGSLALDIDSSNQVFEINKKEVDNSNLTASNSKSLKVIQQEIVEKDTTLLNINNFELSPNQYVEKQKFNIDPIEDKEKVEKQFIPTGDPKDQDLAIATPSQIETQSTDIKLVEIYQSVTNLTNSYTDLAVSYKKSTPDSEFKVTSFSIGKFSFERKRRL